MSSSPSPFGLFVLGSLVVVVAVFVLAIGGHRGGAGQPSSQAEPGTGQSSSVAPGREPLSSVASGREQSGSVAVGEQSSSVASGTEQSGSDAPGEPSGAVASARRPASSGDPAGQQAGQVGAAPREGAAAPVQVNPEAVDPALGREHERLLADRPLFQHLPYRDTLIGVDFDRVLSGGKLELLVTYLGSRARAAADLRRLLARYGDPGTAYVERYERVF